MAAVRQALAHDSKIVIEEGVAGFEVGCAALGNQATEPDPETQYQQLITHRSEPCPHWQWHHFLQVDM